MYVTKLHITSIFLQAFIRQFFNGLFLEALCHISNIEAMRNFQMKILSLISEIQFFNSTLVEKTDFEKFKKFK